MTAELKDFEVFLLNEWPGRTEDAYVVGALHSHREWTLTFYFIFLNKDVHMRHLRAWRSKKANSAWKQITQYRQASNYQDDHKSKWRW